MGDERPWIPPVGLPPGHDPNTERAPTGVVSFRVFAAFVIGLCGLAIVVGAVGLVRALHATRAFGTDAYGQAAIVACAFVLELPYLIVLLAPRRAWVHTLGTVALAIVMTTVCCVPIVLPVLAVWVRPETRRYFVPPAG